MSYFETPALVNRHDVLGGSRSWPSPIVEGEATRAVGELDQSSDIETPAYQVEGKAQGVSRATS